MSLVMDPTLNKNYRVCKYRLWQTARKSKKVKIDLLENYCRKKDMGVGTIYYLGTGTFMYILYTHYV